MSNLNQSAFSANYPIFNANYPIFNAQDAPNYPVIYGAVQAEQPTHVINFKPEVDQNAYLSKYGLNWTVYKDNLICKSDNLETNQTATRRSDNNKVLGFVGDGYEPFQNFENMLIIDAACQQSGVEMHNAGSLGGGKLVYIQAHSGEVEIGNDRIKKYITVLNSHDGSTSLKWGLSNITIICRNTFFGAFRQVENAARHTSGMREKIAGMIKGIGKAKEQEVKLYDMFSRFADRPIDLKAIEAVTTSVLDLDSLDELKLGDISTRKKNMAAEFSNVMESELASHGKTYWGALSAATYWTTHKAASKERAESKMNGTLHRIDENAFNRLSAILN